MESVEGQVIIYGQFQHRPFEKRNPQISDLDGIQYIGLFCTEKPMIRILELSEQ